LLLLLLCGYHRAGAGGTLHGDVGGDDDIPAAVLSWKLLLKKF